MATALAARIALAISGEFSNILDIGSATYPVGFGPVYALTDGSGANQANKLFTDQRTLAASGTEDLDLNGTLVDAFGNTFSPTKIKALVVVADAANVNDVVVGGASANQAASFFGAATHSVKVKPGGMLVLVAPDATGYAITAGTADLLKIANSSSGSAVTYTIIVIGA